MRLLYTLLSCCIIAGCANLHAQNKFLKPIAGAIRWDAWCGNLNPVGLEVETVLSKAQFHYRAPFYAKEITPDSIQIRCTTQAIIDKEIAYAKYAGIGYWAFCWYPFHSGMDTARTLYLSSKHRNDISWCIILGTAPFDIKTNGPWLVKEFRKTSYQKVCGGLPLVYIWNYALSARDIKSLRMLNKAAGNKEIYFAAMGEEKEKIKLYADSVKANAVSAYITWAYNNGGPYAPLVPDVEMLRWEEHKATGYQVIPWVTLGRNTSPRIHHQVWWDKVDALHWTQDATETDIKNHVTSALLWMQNNRTVTKANTLLLYAWNEFDEGGWICPLLGNDSTRIKTLREVFKK